MANMWKLIGIGFLVVLAFAAAIGCLMWMLSASHMISPPAAGKYQPAATVFLAFIPPYLCMALALGAVWRIYLVQRIWKLVVLSITIENPAAAGHVTAEGSAANALGEGFVDSLDIVGF